MLVYMIYVCVHKDYMRNAEYGIKTFKELIIIIIKNKEEHLSLCGGKQSDHVTPRANKSDLTAARKEELVS